MARPRVPTSCAARVACRTPGANKLDPSSRPSYVVGYVPSAHRACILSGRAHSSIAISAARTTRPSPRSLSSVFPTLPFSSSPLRTTPSKSSYQSHSSQHGFSPPEHRHQGHRGLLPQPGTCARLAPGSPRVASCALFCLPTQTTNCSPFAGSGHVLTVPRRKTVCRAVRARAVRRRQYRKVHNWSRPDQDVFL